MKPGLSVVFFFLIISFVLLLLCLYGDKIMPALENITAQPATKDSYLLIGTPQEILSLQVSKGEIKQYNLFKRGEVDDSKLLPKEFIFVGSDVNRRKNDNEEK